VASFRNTVDPFSYRQDTSAVLYFYQILNESLPCTKYLFVCLLACFGTSLLRVIMQWGVVISYRRFETTYLSHLQGSSIFSWTLRKGTIGSPKTSVRNYRYSLRNNPKEHISNTSRQKPEITQVSLFIYLFICLFIYSFIHSFTYLFISAYPERTRMVPCKTWFFHPDLPSSYFEKNSFVMF
jgi:hypothetical protein